MAARDKRSTSATPRRAAWFLALFALPFAAGGTFAGWLLLANVLSWFEARTWQETPARILEVRLQELPGEGGSTWRVEATYEYAFAGRLHTGHRVALQNRFDNVGSWHQDAYAELAAHQEAGRPFRAFVDPDAPARSVLYRQMRWGLAGLMAVFALAFGLVGYGLMVAAVIGKRRLQERERLRKEHPAAPWAWRPEWAGGRVRAGDRRSLVGLGAIAVLWNLVSAPVIFLIPRELRDDNWLVLIAVVFPLVGLGLILAVILHGLRYRRFGSSILELSVFPAPLGGTLAGRVLTRMRRSPEGGIEATLSCSRPGTGGSDRSKRSKVLWQDTTTIPATALQPGRDGLVVPVSIPLPPDAPPTSDDPDEPGVEWHLELRARLRGVDYEARFEVPVFERGSAPIRRFRIAPPTPDSSRDRLRGLGIVIEDVPAGGIRVTLRRARHKGIAAGATAFLLVWTGIVVLLWKMAAPILFPVLFGLFALLIGWAVAELWLAERRLEVAPDGMTVRSRWIGGGREVELRKEEIAAIEAVPGMQAGSKLYYRLRARMLHDKEQLLATEIDDLRAAEQLAAEIERALELVNRRYAA